MLTNWSFSKLMQYEQCPLRVKFKVIDRIPEPPRDDKSPLERGNREHGRYEKYIKGDYNALEGAEAKQFDQFRPLLDKLFDLYAAGKATAEDDWTLNADWDWCDKSDYWLWSKLDFCVMDEDNAIVIVGDFKTGKSQFKAIEHVQQTQLYAALAALKFEWADTLITELWYVDEGHVKAFEYGRDQALAFVGRFQSRVDRMMADRTFRPSPNAMTCRWCPYGPKAGNGHCPVGV